MSYIQSYLSYALSCTFCILPCTYCILMEQNMKHKTFMEMMVAFFSKKGEELFICYIRI
jgi:hypothetical protein